MRRTLEDILKLETEEREKARQQEDSRKLIPLLTELFGAVISLNEKMEKLLSAPVPVFPDLPKQNDYSEVLEKIASRPDPKFPEQLPYPEVKDLSPLFEELIERIGNEHVATRAVLTDLLNKDTSVVLTEGRDGKKMTLGGGVGSIRRHLRWQVATFPQKNGTLAITSAGDGLTFYLPGKPEEKSETIRLNGGIPSA